MMMRIALLLAGLLMAGAAIADPPPNYPFLSYEEGVRAAQAQERPIFLYFGRKGCGWCDKTNKETFSDASLREQYIDNYVLVYVDAESGKRLTLPSGERITEMELGVRLRVFATPVFAYLNPQGERLYSAPGFKTVQDFKDIDRYVRGGHYQHTSLTEFLASER